MFTVNYVNPGIDLVYDQRHLGPGRQQLIDSIDQKIVDIEDGRLSTKNFSLAETGFEFSKIDFEFDKFEDDLKVQHELFPLVTHWLKTHLGASDLLIFDHTYRSNSRAVQSVHNRAPVKTVHNDYTAKSAEFRLHEETRFRPDLRNKPYQFINLWMPVHHKVEESPLAMVDLNTVFGTDYHQMKLIYPDRIGELAAISYNPQHKWYYFSEMAPGEVLLLKVFDSQVAGDIYGVPHSAVDAVENKSSSKPRNSIEIRTIAFFE